MALYEIKEEKERVILVGVSTRENDDTEDSLDELKDLVKTAGAEAVGRVIQKESLSIRELMSEKARLRRSGSFCGSLTQPGSSVMMSCLRHR